MVASCETGRRRPTRETLLRLMRAMELDGVSINAILTGADMSPEPSEWALLVAGQPLRTQTRGYATGGGEPRPWAAIQADIDRHPWPCLVVDAQCDIAGWNAVAARMLGWDGRGLRAAPPQRNLVRLALGRWFRAHVLNWAEVASALVPSTLKEVLSYDGGDGEPAVRRLAASIRAEEPESVARVEELWRATLPAVRTRRVAVPLVWRAEDGATLRFTCLITPWSAFDPLWALDWHPADVETWLWLSARSEEIG